MRKTRTTFRAQNTSTSLMVMTSYPCSPGLRIPKKIRELLGAVWSCLFLFAIATAGHQVLPAARTGAPKHRLQGLSRPGRSTVNGMEHDLLAKANDSLMANCYLTIYNYELYILLVVYIHMSIMVI